MFRKKPVWMTVLAAAVAAAEGAGIEIVFEE